MLWRMPLAVLEAKREGEPASNGMQQGSRYAQRLGLRFSIASNGREYIVTDNETGKYESFATPPLARRHPELDGPKHRLACVAPRVRSAMARGSGHPKAGTPVPGDRDLRDALPLLAERETNPVVDGHRHGQDLHRVPARVEAPGRQRPSQQSHPLPDRPEQPQGPGVSGVLGLRRP